MIDRSKGRQFTNCRLLYVSLFFSIIPMLRIS